MAAILEAWSEGDAGAVNRLFPLVYCELETVAAHYLSQERQGHIFQAEELVHEVYLRLSGRDRPRWRGRRHFFTTAALLMRRVLVDRARRGRAGRRGGESVRVELSESSAVSSAKAVDSIALSQALKRLAQVDRRGAQVAELRLLSELGLDEIAETLQVSQSTIVRAWRQARAWLKREIYGELEAR